MDFLFNRRILPQSWMMLVAGDEDFDSQMAGEYVRPKKRRVRQVKFIFQCLVTMKK